VIRINLMPREERPRRRALPTIKLPALGAFVPALLGSAVVAGIAAVHTLQVRHVAQLESEISRLQEESESYKPQLARIHEITQKRQEVANRLDIIAKLDQERYYRVKLMDELSRSVPENMWLTKMDEQADHKFQIEGVTFSNMIVARFMNQVEQAPHWNNVELGVAQQGKIDKFDVVQFTLVSGSQP